MGPQRAQRIQQWPLLWFPLRRGSDYRSFKILIGLHHAGKEKTSQIYFSLILNMHKLEGLNTIEHHPLEDIINIIMSEGVTHHLA